MQDDWMTADSTRVQKACAHMFTVERRRVVGGLFLLCCPVALQAAEWSFNPAVSVALGYESNASLTTDPHDAVSEVRLVPRFVVRRVTETSAADFELVAGATYYTGNEFEDVVDGRVELSSFVQSTERTKLGLDVSSRWDHLFNSAVTSTGTGDVQDIDIGLTTNRIRRNWSELLPSVSYALSERSWVAFEYRLTDVEFGDVGESGLVDYQQHYVSGVYSYRLTVTNDLQVIVTGGQYRPASGTDSDTKQLLAGIVHRFSTTADAGFRAGVGKTTETTLDGSQVDTSTYVLQARAAQQSELSKLEAEISHDVQPSGIGQSVSANQLRLDWNRKLSPSMAFLFRATAFRAEALQGPDPTVDRRYADAETGVGWILSPEWSLSVRYQYRYQKFDADMETAQSNGVFAKVSWAPPARR